MSGEFEKCNYVWLFNGRHLCDRIKGHAGFHRCEVCDVSVVSAPANKDKCPPHNFDQSGYCRDCGTLIEDQ